MERKKENVTLFVVLARLHATLGSTYIITAVLSPAVLYGNTKNLSLNPSIAQGIYCKLEVYHTI